MPSSSVRLFSPAKINLFLRVLYKRQDGYHEVATLMQALDFGDVVTLEKSRVDALDCTDRTVPSDRSNLVWRALDLFREKTGRDFFVRMVIDKKIPPRAGLGGGSSNAATTLFGLSQLTNWPMDIQTLQQWSAALSSDAPFFFSQGTGYATGRNEKIENLPSLPLQELSLLTLPWGLATEAVYARCSPPLGSCLSPKDLLQRWMEGKPIAVNDLEPAAFALKPALSSVKKELMEEGFSCVGMTGSGTTLYALGSLGKKTFLPKQGNLLQTRFLQRKEDQWYRA